MTPVGDNTVRLGPADSGDEAAEALALEKIFRRAPGVLGWL
jgi:hypothetical protein